MIFATGISKIGKNIFIVIFISVAYRLLSLISEKKVMQYLFYVTFTNVFIFLQLLLYYGLDWSNRKYDLII